MSEKDQAARDAAKNEMAAEYREREGISNPSYFPEYHFRNGFDAGAAHSAHRISGLSADSGPERLARMDRAKVFLESANIAQYFNEKQFEMLPYWLSEFVRAEVLADGPRS